MCRAVASGDHPQWLARAYDDELDPEVRAQLWRCDDLEVDGVDELSA